MRGLSELNGSWKTICICAAQRAHVALAERLQIAGRRSRSRPRCAPAAAGRGRASSCPSRFRRPRPSVWPSRSASDAVDRLHVADGPAQHAALDREPDLEVVALARSRGASAVGGARAGPWARPRADAACRGAAAGRRPRPPGPARRSRPAVITQTRSAILRTMPRSWVMSSSAMPSCACRLFSSFRICAWMVTSSAVVGSSAISRSGSLASAMAIITRWRWPPESWCG